MPFLAFRARDSPCVNHSASTIPDRPTRRDPHQVILPRADDAHEEHPLLDARRPDLHRSRSAAFVTSPCSHAPSRTPRTHDRPSPAACGAPNRFVDAPSFCFSIWRRARMTAISRPMPAPWSAPSPGSPPAAPRVKDVPAPRRSIQARASSQRSQLGARRKLMPAESNCSTQTLSHATSTLTGLHSQPLRSALLGRSAWRHASESRR
jgi:hypothetical protein